MPKLLLNVIILKKLIDNNKRKEKRLFIAPLSMC